nr:hypothetical protein [uncultured Romboutsia sp.]
MIPIYPPKVFKIISSISQNLYGIKPWINSTPKVIINTAKRVLVLFFSNLMYIKNPKGINKTILPITLYINCPNGYSKSIFKIILNGTILNISNPSNLYPSLIGNNVNDIINNIDKNKKKFKISDL